MRSGPRWIRRHAQRLGIALVAATLVVAVGAAVVGAFRLRDARDLERRIVRDQELQTAVLELQVADRSGSPSRRRSAQARTAVAFADIERHDAAGARRLRPSYLAVARAAQPTSGETRRLTAAIEAELAGASNEMAVVNPSARGALIAAALATALLIATLAWQFELARRAGRIDRDLAARAEELASLRSSLVGVVSHELRTPLTSIIGYLELLDDDGALRAEQTTYLATARRSAERLASLVDELLTLTEAGRTLLGLETERVDPGTLVRETVTAAQPVADARSIELRSEVRGHGAIVGDPKRLAQMLDNLVSNALKFTPDGGRVTVTSAHDGREAVFEVADTGVGISAADRSQLFDPFFRSREATAQAIPGTGLGLTITKAIVDAHRASIEVESAAGRGTTFRVRIPAAPEPAADEAATPEPGSAATSL